MLFLYLRHDTLRYAVIYRHSGISQKVVLSSNTYSLIFSLPSFIQFLFNCYLFPQGKLCVVALFQKNGVQLNIAILVLSKSFDACVILRKPLSLSICARRGDNNIQLCHRGAT